jgi:hypothetical protein
MVLDQSGDTELAHKPTSKFTRALRDYRSAFFFWEKMYMLQFRLWIFSVKV